MSDCATTKDVYDHLGALALPSQTLSLLQNRATFLLTFANRVPAEVQARFSVTLYHTLYNEFFGRGFDSKNNLVRQSYLLRRVHLLQEYLQQGIPVVGRFLAEYLVNWDGQRLLVDVLNLLTYIQITDFQSAYLQSNRVYVVYIPFFLQLFTRMFCRHFCTTSTPPSPPASGFSSCTIFSS